MFGERGLAEETTVMIIGWNLSPREGGRAACVCKGFRACVDRARATKGMLKSDLVCIAADGEHMVACTARGVFTWGVWRRYYLLMVTKVF